MKIVNNPKIHKYNCLFLPGMPGRVKQFSFFRDITETGGKIHWLQYGGTYDKKDLSDFTVQSSIKDVNKAIEELSKDGLPILIVAYSYSTYIIKYVDLGKYPLIFGMALFSPIHNLSIESIGEDFSKTIEKMAESGLISTKLSSWKKEVNKKPTTSLSDDFMNLSKYKFPVMIAYSEKDTTIKARKLSDDLNSFLDKYGYNKLLVYKNPSGHHQVDTYYNDDMRMFFKTLEAEMDLK